MNIDIDTGELTTKSRKSIFSLKNIPALIIVVLIQILIAVLNFSNDLVPFFVQAVFSILMVRIGMRASKENFKVEVVKKDGREWEGEEEGEGEREEVGSYEVRYLEIQKNDRVYIGDQIVQLLAGFVKNFRVYAILIAIQMFMRYTLYKGTIHFEYFSIIQQIVQIERYRNYYHYSQMYYLYRTVIQQILSPTKLSILLHFHILELLQTFGLTCIKCAILANIERREYMVKLKEREKEWLKNNGGSGNGSEEKGEKKGQGKGQGEVEGSYQKLGVRDFWRNFMKLSVIRAFGRLWLRTVWTIIFAGYLQQYFYVCFGFFFRKVMKPQFQLQIIEAEKNSRKTQKKPQSPERFSQQHQQHDPINFCTVEAKLSEKKQEAFVISEKIQMEEQRVEKGDGDGIGQAFVKEQHSEQKIEQNKHSENE